ncbi:DUF1173 domain-containing protein [Ramlibacter monticola]|uniref:DUF1173 domain-containing protein n=1 Tax=Ramlibacter monticola TaxID=1926872 RepID=UPI001F1FE51A|nr:DUF1173 domain-containing protein [Ramlibacter monticola]
MSVLGITAPSAVYEVGGRRFDSRSPGFAEAIADAHHSQQRPRCMCLVEGVEMYVARLGHGYIVKRMPDTGSHHAPDCPSYDPPAEFSGLGQVLGSAITEDPATGETTLKLDFPLTKMPGRAQMPPAGGDDSVASDGTKLSLRGLLHYLWDQAELTRWHPGFAGKRTWATVRRHLLQSAELKLARGDALRARLYVPEPFSIDQRDAINARRLAHWQHALPVPGKPQHLMLLIGEVKEIVPARYGFKAVVKHVPDQAFALDEQLYGQLGRRFESELALWGAAEDVQMVMIATFSVSAAGVPTIVELSLMPVTRQWLPVEGVFEKQLIERLVADGRSFVKGLRYNLGAGSALASAMLTDCDGASPLLFIAHPGIEDTTQCREVCDASLTVWLWNPSSEAMPSPPPRPTPHPKPPESGVE